MNPTLDPLDAKRPRTPLSPPSAFPSTMPRRKYGRMVHDVGSNAGKNSAQRNKAAEAPKS